MTLEISREMKLKEVRRELTLRHEHYPRYVEAKRMGSVEADTRIATMRAIVNDYSKRMLNENQRRDLRHAIRMASIADGKDQRDGWDKLEALIEGLRP